MSTRWVSPLTPAREPAPRRRYHLVGALVWLLPVLCFWGAVALIVYAKGWV